jgi:uncharacterized membrane protein YeaQ/YmgE (transglycosylase-associated protein family)
MRPTRPPEQSDRHRAVAALLLGVVSLLSLFGIGSDYHRGIYLVAFAVLVGLIAGWFGMMAIRSARRQGTLRPRWALFGTVLGAIGAVGGALMLLFFAAYWQQLNSYSQCMNSANTQSAQQACVNQLHRSVGLGGLGTGR